MNLISKTFLLLLLNIVFLSADTSVITDTKQKLQWEDRKNKEERIWKLAKSYCKQLKLHNHKDWR